MRRYPVEQKETLIKRMMPPHNTPVMTLVEETGISNVMLYNWCKQARERGSSK